MKRAPVIEATAIADLASFRSILMPRGRSVTPLTASTASVIDATVCGPTLSFSIGESPKFSTIIAETPPEASASAIIVGNSLFYDDNVFRILDEIGFNDFDKVDLRVARVLNVEEIPEARKLLKLTLGLGGDTTRTVLAGIKAAYDPADLIGRKVVVVANLAPRKMKFGVSEGMVVAAGPGGNDVFLLGADDGALPGQRVH